MKKVFWFVSFLIDVVIFVTAGLGVMLFHLLISFVSLLIDLITAIVTFDGMYILSCLHTMLRLLTEYPVRTFRILWERLKKSYKQPVIFTIEENEENVDG